MLGDECLQQVLDPVRYDPATCFSLLGREVASVELRCEHLLGRHPRLMERYAAVGADGIFAQPRARAAGAVEYDEYLAALRRDLHAEAGRSGVPIDYI
jgi:hypothetical protein